MNFFLAGRKLFFTPNTLMLLSMDCPAKYLPLGCMVTAGIECIVGSLIHFTGTLVFHSHTNTFLSS